MKLTTTTIRTLSLPPGVKDKTFWDDDLPGFGRRLRAGGSATWVVQYDFGGKTERMALGSKLDPGVARATAKNLLAAVRLGRNPAAEKRGARTEVDETFSAILPQFLARQRGRRKQGRSFAEVERHLLVHSKALHSLQLAKVDRRVIAKQLMKIEATSSPTVANAVRTSLSTFMTWAMREGLIDANPVVATNRANGAAARDHVPTNRELCDIWRALEEDDHGTIVKLLLLTGQRRDEIGSLRWSEIDVERALITLPGARTKNGRPHEIPLSSIALALLKSRPRRPDRDLVFGAGAGAFSGWSKAKAHLDRRIAEANMVEGKPPVEPWRLHDLRRVVSTQMHGALGVAPHIVEAVLNHVSGHKAGVAGVYNRAAYAAEKRQALDRWAAHLMAIIEGREDNIVALRAAQ
jgi:integrase